MFGKLLSHYSLLKIIKLLAVSVAFATIVAWEKQANH